MAKHISKTTPQPTDKSNSNRVITSCIIFVIGFLAGVAFTVYKAGFVTPTANNAKQEQAAPHNEESHQALQHLEAEVTTNPGNFQAWTNLGNLYYDTDQPSKAIAAYNKSLALHKGDANLLTDLGVMYRKNKQPEKAIELFDQASRETPNHLPSRYNKGIVLFYDLSDTKGAVASWEEMLKIDPQAKTGDGMTISELIAKIKADEAGSK